MEVGHQDNQGQSDEHCSYLPLMIIIVDLITSSQAHTSHRSRWRIVIINNSNKFKNRGNNNGDRGSIISTCFWNSRRRMATAMFLMGMK